MWCGRVYVHVVRWGRVWFSEARPDVARYGLCSSGVVRCCQLCCGMVEWGKVWFMFLKRKEVYIR